MSPNLNSVFYDSTVSSPTEPQVTSEGAIDGKVGLSYIFSTVMVFNPNFNFGNVVKRSSTGSNCNGTFTSWFESDGETSPLRNTALARIEETPISPKSKPVTFDPKKNINVVTDRKKVYPESNGSRIEAPAPRPKSNRKVNTKKQQSSQIETKVPFGKSSKRLDRHMADGNTEYNSILLFESQDENQDAGRCRSQAEGKGGVDNQARDYQKSILNSTTSLPYSSSNSSTSTLKPTDAPASPPAEETSNSTLRAFRPRLQLRTSVSTPTFRTTPVLVAPASGRRRDSKEKSLTQSIGPRASSSPSAVSVASSPEREATETPQQPRTKLPLQSLLLSPLGAVARNRSRSTSRVPSSGISFTNYTHSDSNKSNSTARSSFVSVSPSTCQEIGEADEAVAELSEMVSHGPVVGTAKEQQPSGSSRPVSRFRRFSLAYLSGSEHDYDGGSEQSSRSPLRSWKSWSNRSSIASLSSVSNKHSKGRYSAASISTSQGSASSSSSTSAVDNHTHPETGAHADDKRRPSLSVSSVAELSWRQVPQQTYAHLMSSRRNSVATTTASHPSQYLQTLNQTFATAKSSSSNLTATTPRSSDGLSIHSLVERVYSAPSTAAAENVDHFTAFYMATKPKTSPLEIQAQEIRAYEKQQRQEKLLQRIANGSFFDSDDESDDDDEEAAGMVDEDEDLLGHSAAQDWWMSEIEEVPEDDDWEIPRVPSLEFDPRPKQRESSISTGTTLTTDDLHPSTPTAAEIAHHRKITELAMTEPPEKRRRRRTASSECLIAEAAEGLRTMYIEEPSDDCAVEEEDNILGTKLIVGQLSLTPVKPLSLPPVAERASRRSITASSR